MKAQRAFSRRGYNSYGHGQWFAAIPLNRAPVIWLPLVVQLPDASDMSPVAILLGPFDCFVLRLEGRESVVSVSFDYIVLDSAALRYSLRPWLNEYVPHGPAPS